MLYIAHKCEDGKTQSVREHLNNVAVLSSEFAIAEMKELCLFAGLLHDAGKYDNKRKKLRKLHNYADSVIIFDEIHLMPIDRMQPCLRAVEYIASVLHSDIVFCTATMPNFRGLFGKYTSLNMPLIELAEDKSKFYMFDKCKYNTGIASLTPCLC